MSAQFAIHPFETPINYRSLLFAVFRELLQSVLERSDWCFELLVLLERTIPVPSDDSTSRPRPVRAGRARRDLVQDEAPPGTGKLLLTRRDTNRRRAPAPAPNRSQFAQRRSPKSRSSIRKRLMKSR
jgi:hypothetical protein